MHKQRKNDLNMFDYNNPLKILQVYFLCTKKALTHKKAEIKGFLLDFGQKNESFLLKMPIMLLKDILQYEYQF